MLDQLRRAFASTTGALTITCRCPGSDTALPGARIDARRPPPANGIRDPARKTTTCLPLQGCSALPHTMGVTQIPFASRDWRMLKVWLTMFLNETRSSSEAMPRLLSPVADGQRTESSITTQFTFVQEEPWRKLSICQSYKCRSSKRRYLLYRKHKLRVPGH